MIAKARIVRLGNSRGIRVPKGLLEHAQLPDEVELHAAPGRLMIRAAHWPRAAWAAAAKAMRAESDDKLLDEPTPTRFDAPRQEELAVALARWSFAGRWGICYVWIHALPPDHD